MEIWPRPGSFSEYMMQRAPFAIADLPKETRRLSRDHIEFMMALSIILLLRRQQYAEETLVTFELATFVLRFYLGDEWTQANLYPPQQNAPLGEGRQFLKTGSSEGDTESRFRHLERVHRLASYLYNLQDVPGIEHRVAAIRHDGDLESAVGEFDCAGLVAAPQYRLRFVVPVGRLGSDYEAEFTTPGGLVVCCEIKTKKEETALSIATVRNTCDHARKQLPKGKPGIIFLSVPEGWVDQAFSWERVSAGIDKVLRQSKRLVAVVVLREEWNRTPLFRVAGKRFNVIHNRRNSQYAADIEESFAQAGRQLNPNWLHLIDYVRERRHSLAPAVGEFLKRKDREKRTDPHHE